MSQYRRHVLKCILISPAIINGEIKQTQLGITCIASIQYHTQYISMNTGIHSTKYQYNYKIRIFWHKSSAYLRKYYKI
jgi:CRISPR/Cas system CMR-associated protein Cmr3 (group 5 of RAMP superfamily)